MSSVGLGAPSNRRSDHLWLRYAATTMLGAALAGAATVAAWSTLVDRAACFDDVPGPCAKVYALMWFTSAIGAALGQTLVLRRLIARAQLWPVVTVAGTVVGTSAALGLLALATPASHEATGNRVLAVLAILALGPLCGFILGWSQHWLLRPLGISRRWIIATTAAAFVTAPLFATLVRYIGFGPYRIGESHFAFSNEVQWSIGALGLALMWTIVALAAGLVLQRGLRRTPTELHRGLA